MTQYVVSSGQTDELFTLHSGDVMSVLSSGTSEQTLVSSGGRLIVADGGESLADTVFGGGVEVLASGATAANLTVSAGGVASDGGFLLGTTVDFGVISGGEIVAPTPGAFGSLTVGSGGVASGVTGIDAFVFVQSGGTTRNLLATGGTAVTVSAGGGTTGTILRSSIEFLSGSDLGMVISSGGSGMIFAGAHSIDAVVSSGGILWISSGGAASGAVILSSGSGLVDFDGNATGAVISNGGSELIESGGVGQSSVIASGGRALVESGGLASAFTISSGGGLTVEMGGVLRVGATGTSTNFGYVDVQSSCEMDLAGTLDNGGVVDLDNSNTVDVKVASATLTGSGVIDMENAVLITGLANIDTLDNESNTIEGTGQIGGESLTVINRGAIDANQATALTLNATALTNTGLIEATNATGGLIVFGAIKNAGGVFEAKGGDVDLETGSTISGGVLSAAAAGAFMLEGSAGLNGAGQAITNKAEVNVQDGTALTLDGAIDNVGEISLGAAGDDTDLIIDGPTVTLTGSGTIEMSDSANNRIYGDATTFSNVLDNVDDTIEGSGEIGLNELTLVNSGTIDATGTAEALLLQTTSATNTGLIESTAVGGLVIAANRGDIVFEDGAAINGGVLSSSPQSQIEIENATTAVTLNGAASPLTNNGDISVADASQLDLVGAIVNSGAISIDATAGFTDLMVNGSSATLTGGGTVELSDSLGNRIYAAAAADTLTNVNNTIEGAGQIGNTQLTLVNRGTIDASGANALFLNTTSSVNTGLIESTGAGGLIIETVVRNSGGVIAANGGGVSLEIGAVVSGGLLSATAQADFFVTDSATLNGVASPLSNTATVFVEDAAQISLAGAIVNDGIIALNADADDTDLLVSTASATLAGSGTIELIDSADNRIYGAASTDVLDNETDTIEGAGQIGVGQLTLINRGTIDATGKINALVVSTTSATNTGLMEATTAPGLVLESLVVNTGGVIGAFGGDVYVEQGAAISGGTLSGENGGVGEFQVLSGGSVLGASIASGAVEILSSGAKQSGVIVLSGGVATVSSGAGTSGGTISAGGVLQGPGSLHGAVVDAGLVSGAAVVSGGSLTISSGGVASATRVTSGGLEYVRASGTAEALLVSSGGKVVVSSGGLGSGTKVLNGGVEDVMASGTTTGTVVSSGGKQIVSSGGLASGARVLSGGQEYVYSGGRATGATISSGGAETISSGGVASGLALLSGGVLIDEGEVRIVGAGKLAGTVSGSGSIVEAGGGDVLLSGSGAAFGGRAVISGGTLELATAGALGTGSVDFVEPATGSAVLQIDAGDAPTAGGTFANVISNFSGANEDIDLRSIAFVAGASATVSGGVLTLSDDGKTYKFDLAGSIAGAYPVLSDGHGGTLIDPKAIAFTHAAAAFAPSHAAIAALVSSTSPTSRTPFAYATASAGHI
jgi:autotransporter passenger strand-loop-strand repeat protein